jgi:hypothetical protein
MSHKQRTGNITGTKSSVFTDREQRFVLDPAKQLPSSAFHVRMRRGTISDMLYCLLNKGGGQISGTLKTLFSEIFVQ